MPDMRRAASFVSILFASALCLATLGAGPSKSGTKPTPTPEVVEIDASDVDGGAAVEEDAIDVAPEEGLDYELPGEADPQALGASYVDTNFLFTVPSPGAEWTRIAPVPDAPGLRAAFVHARGPSVLSMFTVAVDPAPKQKDVGAYAQAAFATLTAPPLLFKISSKATRTLAGKKAFTIVYTNTNGTRTYEQVYLPGASGTIVVLTFQAPTKLFERESKAFRAVVAAMKI